MALLINAWQLFSKCLQWLKTILENSKYMKNRTNHNRNHNRNRKHKYTDNHNHNVNFRVENRNQHLAAINSSRQCKISVKQSLMQFKAINDQSIQQEVKLNLNLRALIVKKLNIKLIKKLDSNPHPRY